MTAQSDKKVSRETFLSDCCQKSYNAAYALRLEARGIAWNNCNWRASSSCFETAPLAPPQHKGLGSVQRGAKLSPVRLELPVIDCLQIRLRPGGFAPWIPEVKSVK